MVGRINKRRNESVFPYCSSVRDPFAILELNFTSEFTLNVADSFASAPFTKLLIFIVNRLLNDDTKLEKFWHSFGKKCFT